MARQQVTLQRSGEYFDPNELRKLSGLEPGDRALGIGKELLDDALDAAEETGVPPGPAVGAFVDCDDTGAPLDTGAIAVADNGAGLPPDLVPRLIDFASKTSDKVRYCAPTPGAQGNAALGSRLRYRGELRLEPKPVPT